MNAPLLKFDAKQSQTLTPRLQYAVRLLQLSSLDYEQELQEVMSKNPFLEVESTGEQTVPVSEALWSSTGTSDAEVAAPPASDVATESADDLGSDRDWLNASTTTREPGAPSTVTALDLVHSQVGLRDQLRGQANTLPLSARDHTLVCAIVESLDDDGYLRTSLDEIAALVDLDPHPDASEMSTALKLVQSFEPAGVGARDVGECLTLQLRQLPAAQRELASAIVAGHLDRLAQRDLPGLARALGREQTEIEAACAAIRRLDPRPGWRHGRPEVQFIVPDVIVRKIRGRWTVALNSAVVPKVRLNQAYAELFREHREACHGQLASHLQEARWAVRNVEQRFSTILAVSEEILRRQHLFFEYGPLAMKPLGLREVADKVGLHESTVCRVTNNKYMATPTGVFELKYFFSRSMPLANGGACSAVAIRGVVKELIDSEDEANPLSDVEIAQRLVSQGLTVARRTVTKYRQMLKIPPVERRRRSAAVPSSVDGA
ncbi:MAG TPA: RNA polymerase factor sigma-54 [Burkholderiaceae bacterium]|nr:RNA polymerase factor sigma-54 [Burkholderiaceae bacterium]